MSTRTRRTRQPISPRKAVVGVILLLLVAGRAGRSRHSAAACTATRCWPRRTDRAGRAHGDCCAAKPGAPVDSFVLPGNVTAYTDSPIYARTDGYLTHWYFDIGAQVKKGALLCEIASPEMDQQLAQAAGRSGDRGSQRQQRPHPGRALHGTGQIERRFATGYRHVCEPGSGDSWRPLTRHRQMCSGCSELVSFEKVYAPFDGVVTARDVDTGQLIDQGAGDGAVPHAGDGRRCAFTPTCRRFTRRPSSAGLKLDLTFPEHPGRSLRERWCALPMPSILRQPHVAG